MAEREHFTNGRCFAFGGGLALVGSALSAQIANWVHWITIGIGYGSGITLMILSAVWITRSYYQRNDPEAVRARTPQRFKAVALEQQQPLIDRYFSNEVVDVDGKSFQRCTFRNVTMRYNDTASFSITQSSFGGIKLQSDSGEVNSAWILAVAVGGSSMPLFDENNQPLKNILPPAEKKAADR